MPVAEAICPRINSASSCLSLRVGSGTGPSWQRGSRAVGRGGQSRSRSQMRDILAACRPQGLECPAGERGGLGRRTHPAVPAFNREDAKPNEEQKAGGPPQHHSQKLRPRVGEHWGQNCKRESCAQLPARCSQAQGTQRLGLGRGGPRREGLVALPHLGLVLGLGERGRVHGAPRGPQGRKGKAAEGVLRFRHCTVPWGARSGGPRHVP